MAPKTATKEAKEITRKSTNKKVTSGATKAGLIFPVGRTARYLKQGRYCDRYGRGAAVFMASVLEYLTCEILELAGNAAAENGKKTIQPKHLQLAVRNDEELAKLMASTMIANGGYMSNIHPFLLKGKKGGKQGKDDALTQEM